MGFEAAISIKIHRELGVPSEKAASALTELQDQPKKPSVKSTVQDSEMSCTGSVRVRRGNVKITYSEPGGMDVTVSFSKDDPGLVTVVRKSLIFDNTIFLVFEKGVRHVCVNSEGGDNFEVTSFASELSNTVTRDGRLKLAYTVELHGLRIERTEISFCVTKITN